jgi:pimeloyl-ACP methyl ester carboxylesterase
MKSRIISALALLLVSIQLSSAQELKRKGLLGIMMESVNDSIARQMNLKDTSGLYLSMVMPGSTFANLGVEAGDVLTVLNGEVVNTPQDVLNITGGLYEGAEISITYQSKNGQKNASTALLGRPKESFKNAEVTYGQVNYPGNRLRSILVCPEGVVNPPVVYFLQGYTCGSVETVTDDSPMKKLMNDWLNAGFAVYRVEKPGVGDSQSSRPCSVISFDEELKAFEEGYKDLLANKSVDKDNIFLFGHSMGGVVAPLLEKVHVPKGTIVYGTVGDNWFDYMVDLYTIQPKHFGVSDAQIKEDNKVNLQFNKDFLIRKLSGKELMANETYVDFFRNGELDFENEQYIGRHFDFWQNLADVDIPGAWAKVQTNVLALYGEFDIQAISVQGVEKIKEIVNSHKGEATVVVIPNADHGFVNFNSMQHNATTLGNGTYMQHARDNYSELLGKETSRWMRSKLGSS